MAFRIHEIDFHEQCENFSNDSSDAISNLKELEERNFLERKKAEEDYDNAKKEACTGLVKQIKQLWKDGKERAIAIVKARLASNKGADIHQCLKEAMDNLDFLVTSVSDAQDCLELLKNLDTKTMESHQGTIDKLEGLLEVANSDIAKMKIKAESCVCNMKKINQCFEDSKKCAIAIIEFCLLASNQEANKQTLLKKALKNHAILEKSVSEARDCLKQLKSLDAKSMESHQETMVKLEKLLEDANSDIAKMKKPLEIESGFVLL